MNDWIRIAACTDLSERATLRATIAGAEEVCLYRINGSYFATSNRCTHGQAALSDGLVLDGGLIECPLHEGTFEIRTGRAVGAPCTVALRTYDIKVEDGSIFLRR
ncbi:MAG TPA: non-heme iron oxygenase ferredoxin subunit [Steroidobacteraceae bacterium]|nr:non-heme iron oxygenase ferredoxin subunit [Steroidobacteraceae bacterium]